MRRSLNRFGITKNYMRKNASLDSLPTEIVLETTNQCNIRCTMCAINHMKRPVGRLPLDKFKRVIDEIKDYAELVYLHGLGEPLLHPDIVEMVSYCASSNIRSGISTNATVLDAAMAKALLKAGLDYIILAVDGAARETFEKIRLNADYNKVTANIRDFLDIKGTIKNKNFAVVQMVLSDETRGERDDFLKQWSRRKNLDAVRIKRLIDLRFMKGDSRPAGICDKPCFYLWRQANIYWDGTVSLCCMANDNEEVVGNIFTEGSLAKVWNSEAMKEKRALHLKRAWSTIPICNRCDIPQPSYLAIMGLTLLNTYTARRIMPFIEGMKIFGEFS
ncbi:MAG: radical SAM protein [Candidatus Omnitrophica bacterium]|nr:radical SAM protein [Candidatus Omnitrophota bacterium]